MATAAFSSVITDEDENCVEPKKTRNRKSLDDIRNKVNIINILIRFHK